MGSLTAILLIQKLVHLLLHLHARLKNLPALLLLIARVQDSTDLGLCLWFGYSLSDGRFLFRQAYLCARRRDLLLHIGFPSS